MGDDFRPGALEDDRAEVMVGMVVGENQPLDRLLRRLPNRLEEPGAVAGARERVDHHDPSVVTTNPAFGLPSDPRPVSPTTA